MWRDSAVGFLISMLLTGASPLNAQDGLYGRFSGDLSWMVSVLGGVAMPLTSGRAQGVISPEVRLHYLETAGIWVGPEWGLAAPEYQRTRLGADIRPLFLARFFQNFETQRTRWDMFLDSWTLEMSAMSPHRGGEWGLSAGLGCEIPFLVRERDGDAWVLRLLSRYNHSEDPLGASRAHIDLLVGIGFRSFFSMGIASYENRIRYP